MSHADAQPYLASFERTAERRTAEPDWLRARREAAIARFAEFGFPTPRLEDWKYTSLRDVSGGGFVPSPAAPHGFGRGAAERGLGPRFPGPVLAFVNGRFAPDLSVEKPVGDGVVVQSLRAALAEHPELLEPHLGRIARFDEPDESLVALNTALAEDGAFVRVPRGLALDLPIGLVFLAAGDAPALSTPRVLIVAEPGSRATVVEAYAGAGGAPQLTDAVGEIAVGADARVDHVVLQIAPEADFHVGALQVQQERDSRFESRAFSLGARLSRGDTRARIAGAGAEAVLDGLFVAADGQHTDHHTEIDHAEPNGRSRELYKGILTDSGRGVFNGRIIVRPDAQKTSAEQKNQNLLLSEDARIDTKPQLEIHADDVKCSHGSTIGHLDDAALFYLRARGIDGALARQLLTRAFASEVADAVALPSVREHLLETLGRRLAGALPGAAS